MHPVGVEVLDRAHDFFAARPRAADDHGVLRRVDAHAVIVRDEPVEELHHGGGGGIFERDDGDAEARLRARRVDRAAADRRRRDPVGRAHRGHRQALHRERRFQRGEELGSVLRCRGRDRDVARHVGRHAVGKTEHPAQNGVQHVLDVGVFEIEAIAAVRILDRVGIELGLVSVLRIVVDLGRIDLRRVGLGLLRLPAAGQAEEARRMGRLAGAERVERGDKAVRADPALQLRLRPVIHFVVRPWIDRIDLALRVLGRRVEDRVRAIVERHGHAGIGRTRDTRLVADASGQQRKAGQKYEDVHSHQKCHPYTGTRPSTHGAGAPRALAKDFIKACRSSRPAMRRPLGQSSQIGHILLAPRNFFVAASTGYRTCRWSW